MDKKLARNEVVYRAIYKIKKLSWEKYKKKKNFFIKFVLSGSIWIIFLGPGVFRFRRRSSSSSLMRGESRESHARRLILTGSSYACAKWSKPRVDRPPMLSFFHPLFSYIYECTRTWGITTRGGFKSRGRR